MRSGSNALTNRLAEIEANSPPISATEALRRNLLHRIISTAEAGDNAEVITGKLMEMAAGGDVRAMKVYFELLRAGGGISSPTHMQQAVIVQSEEKTREVKLISDVRWKAAILLADDGPKDTVDIGKGCGVSTRDAAYAVDHDWFERQPNGRYHVTAKGMTEAVLPMRKASKREPEA